MKKIAVIRTDFKEKFGVPRQSGLSEGAKGKIIFEPEYRNREALRGLSDYSHIWIIWGFSENKETDKGWSPTVRPPRLGGNVRVGVFATRSPNRPNPIGLSSVKLDKIEYDKEFGPVIYVSGVDMLDGTPVYDIKPYIAFTDSHPDAKCGFSDYTKEYEITVEFLNDSIKKIKECEVKEIKNILSQDPRPSYIEDGDRIYGMKFKDYEIKFRVENGTLFVLDII